jgi:integrase
MALHDEHVDLATWVIHVTRSWDAKARKIVEPKSQAGRRRVPVTAELRDILLEQRMRLRRGGLILGTSATTPFDPSSVRARALEAWQKAELEPVTLHGCRHTFASLMIAAGVNAKMLSAYMGHASIVITVDRYGHLMPGNEDEAAGLLSAYLGHVMEAREKND